MSEPIRVLHVVTHMNRGGLETMLMNYYRNIDRNQLQFDFLVHRDKRADYDDEIEKLGGKIYRLPPLNPINIAYRKKLRLFFENHPEYKIVHSHLDCMSAIPLKAAKKAGVPVRIAHSHNINQDKNIKYLIKLFYKRFIAKYATHLIACGAEAGTWMFCNKPFSVIKNAIDSQQYRFDQNLYYSERIKLGLTSDDILIGHVGRFSPQKNHQFIIDIFANCFKLNQKAKLILVGDGTLRSQIEEKARMLGIEKSIIFTGVRKDVNRLMQAMDVFIFPSIYEGLPLTIIEAQAAGLPCLISDAVPDECKLTNLVEQIPLAYGAAFWAKRILEISSAARSDTYKQIQDSGYDIKCQVNKLTQFYVSLL